MKLPKPKSLAGALYIRVMALVAFVAILIATLCITIADRALDRASDAQLVTATNVLLALMGDELDEMEAKSNSGRTIEVDDSLLSAEDARAFHAQADWRMFAVFEHGRVVMRSDTGPPESYLPRDPGFHIFRGRHVRWRSFSLAVPRFGLVLMVAERMHQRHVVLREILAALLIPLLAMVPLAAFLLWFSLGSGLFQLRRLSAALDARSPQELERFEARDWPEEFAVLLTTLNGLFAQLEDAFGREQRLTDETAHQLRTPLAAIKLRAQSLVAASPPSADGEALLLATDRAIALADRMLTAARLGATVVRRRRMDLRDIAIEVATDLAVAAASNDVDFSLEGAATLIVITDPDLLAIALVAVCENAARYAPAGSLVEIATVRDADRATAALVVTDQGPGIALADRRRVLAPLVRLSPDGAGSGLGLTIAKRALDLVGGTISFDDPAGGVGLAVTITVPLID